MHVLSFTVTRNKRISQMVAVLCARFSDTSYRYFLQLYDFIFVFYSKYPSIYYRFRDIAAYWSKIATPCIWRPRWEWSHQTYAMTLANEKLELWAYQVVKECRWYVQPFWHKARVWQTDGRTDGIGVAYTHYSVKMDYTLFGLGLTFSLGAFSVPQAHGWCMYG